ncbi:hypothetical protein ACFTTN_03195 [Streptomyces niveus]|uniref:hypothetical protein n=1 Tax=Streptomyces niveus TaxID=193462 RepID=UPI003632319C
MADHNDRTDHSAHIPGQRQQPPVSEPAAEETTPRLAGLRAWWDTAWDQGGVLHGRWEDLRRAPELGRHGMAQWVKAAIGLAGICAVIILLATATGVLADAMHRLLTAVPDVQVGDDTFTGVWATIDNPVRSYIAAHSAGLPISASTVYTLWQFTGLFSLVAGFITRSNGVRLTWAAWGLAGIAMVWATTPDTSRSVATAIAVLAWTAASAFAMRGLNLRPRVFTNIGGPEITVQPQIHIPAPTTPPTGDAPGSVHPLQKR